MLTSLDNLNKQQQLNQFKLIKYWCNKIKILDTLFFGVTSPKPLRQRKH